MTKQSTLDQRVLVAASTYNSSLGWGLSNKALAHYVVQLVPCLDAQMSELQLGQAVKNYHADHTLVEALRDAQHLMHGQAWKDQVRQVLKVLRAEIRLPDDATFSLDDLVQVACAELVRAIATYRYQSRFSTWAYRVIVQSTQRFLRDQAAFKRKSQAVSLQQYPMLDSPAPYAAHPEVIAAARMLYQQIDAVLSEAGDDRLRLIVYLHAVADQRVDAIGELLHLHPSRIRALLQLARELLHEHPALRAWRDEASARNDHKQA